MLPLQRIILREISKIENDLNPQNQFNLNQSLSICAMDRGQSSSSLYRSVVSPLTAIDKFLSSQSQYYLYDHDHQQPQNNANQNQELVSSNGLCCFSSISVDSIREERSLQESNFDDQLFLDEEDLNYCLQERNPLTFLQEEVKKDGESIIKRRQKRAKKGSSAKLIKGQWTDDEDRFFIFNLLFFFVKFIILRY